MSNKFEQVLQDIAKPFVWLAHEIGRGLKELPKLLTLTQDAESAACECLPKVQIVVEDAGALVAASIKDSGSLVADLTTLGAAIEAAYAAKATNVAADEKVVAVLAKLCADYNQTGWADVMTAWNALVKDVQMLDASVIADLQKLEADARN